MKKVSSVVRTFITSKVRRFNLPSIVTVFICVMTSSAVGAADLGRFVVTFKPGKAFEARTAVAVSGGTVDLDLGWVNAMAVTLPVRAAAVLRHNPAVKFVETDKMRHVMRKPGPATTALPASIPETVPYGISMVQADQVLYDTANPRKLCIIDSGYAYGHEDLQTNNVDGVNLTTSGTWDSDEGSHGTHVAGTAAALGGNGVGVVGVVSSGEMQLYIAKVFDASGSTRSSTVAKGVKACVDAGANVISMSLGGGGSTRFEEFLYNYVAAQNILVVAAAGNSGDNSISYPAGYASVMSVAAVDSSMNWAPFSQFNADVEIAAPGVGVLSTIPQGSQTGATLTVGASVYSVQAMEGSPLLEIAGPLADFGLGDVVQWGTMKDKVCLISRGSISFADKVKNCQRSGGIGAVIYNNVDGELLGTLGNARTNIPSVGATMADGQAMLSQVDQTASVAVFASDDLYAAYDGTSMSTPHVSSVAALVWSHFPACDAAQIRASLDNSARDLGDAGRDDYYGYGLVQARNAIDRIANLGCGN